MPSTHLSLHFHLVFSTKNRLPIIHKDWRANLHAYLGGIVKGIDGVPLAIGGIEDHVHLLIGLRSTHRLDYVLRDRRTPRYGFTRSWEEKRSSGKVAISELQLVLPKSTGLGITF